MMLGDRQCGFVGDLVHDCCRLGRQDPTYGLEDQRPGEDHHDDHVDGDGDR